MRKMKITALAFIFVLIFGTVTCFGTVSGEGYGYTITIYSGAEGHFGSDQDNRTATIECAAGEAASVSLDALDFVLDNDEYYVRGLRQAGHDNDEQIQSLNLESVEEDMAFEVAYGIRGGMVSYVVTCVDAQGNPITEDADGNEVEQTRTYYGMVGDKPVVACHYIEGYQPDALNKGKTLVEDESQNVFPFVYTRVTRSGSGTENEGDENGDNGTGTGDNNGGTTAAGTANGANTAAGTNDGQTAANAGAAANADGDADGGPRSYVDLDDADTPLAGAFDQGSDGSGGGSSHLPLLAGSAAGVLLVAGLLAYFLSRRRKQSA